jgi:S-adenosylmethionine-diacylglycerol 3-amino-3-carboxypropyl transferase
MKHNPIQFAVVREDPLTELTIINRKNIKNVLLIGSGGCTAFSLLCARPTLEVTIFDTNPAQLTLVKNKAQALSNRTNKTDFNATFGIGHEATLGLCSNGNFESLFRGLRNFIFDFVASKKDLLELFQEQNRLEIYRDLITNKYWPVGFELFFSDTLLRAMFTDAAVQHVEKGSYPRYFRRQMEHGLLAKDAPSNYFLHHIFLGHYLDAESKLPLYLSSSNRNFPIKYIHGDLHAVDNLAAYDFISLSNIFDWMSEDQVQESATYLSKKCVSGTTLLWRQLGHDRDMSQFFHEWSFDIKLAEDTLLADRSLFYSRFYIATRR